MSLHELKNSILADATSQRARAAFVENGIFKTEFVSDQPAMESFSDSLSKVCQDFSIIDSYILCTGPGSVLGTRVASAAISTLAKIFDARVFEFDALKIAAFAMSYRGESGDFSILAPSRKGFANLLNFSSGKIKSEAEIKETELEDFCMARRFLLDQKKFPPQSLSGIEKIEISLSETYAALELNPDLAKICDFPPDAKSLTKREYIKWKAQALI